MSFAPFSASNLTVASSVMFLFCVFCTPSALAKTPDTEMSLVDVLEVSMAQNPELQSKQARLQAESQQIDQAWSKVKPNVRATASKGRSQYSTAVASDQDEMVQRMSLDVYQPVYSRKLFLGIDRSELSVARETSSFEFDKQVKLVEVSQAYLEVLRIGELIAISENEMADHKQRIDQLEAMLARGLTNKVDLLEAQSRLDQLNANLVKNKNQLVVAQKSLERLVGMPLDTIEPVDSELWQKSLDIVAVSNWYDFALRSSKAIELANDELALSQMDVEVSRAEYWPELALRASITESDSFETFIDSSNKIQLELSVPLYEGGATNSRVAATRFGVQSQLHLLDNQKSFLRFKLDEVVSKLTGSIANIEALKTARLSNKAYLESAQKGLAFGVRGLFDVLEARARSYDVDRQMVSEKYDNVASQLDFLFLIGELSPKSVEAYLRPSFQFSNFISE